MQDFAFSNLGEILFNEDLCLDADSAVLGDPIKIMGCNELDSQKWKYNKKVRLIRASSGHSCTCWRGGS